MAKRIRSIGRRTPTQAAADRRADDVAAYLGRALANARRARRARQREVAAAAGIAQSTWSLLESGGGAGVGLVVWVRAARAVGADLRAYVEGAASTDQPRDAVHLRAQELIVRTAARGEWRSQPERAVDRDPGRSRVGDVVLVRAHEIAIVEIYDWLPDVGEAFRSWDRRLAAVEARAIALAPPGSDTTSIRVSGTWVLRASRTNRRLVTDHRALFGARFPGSGGVWLRALGDPGIETPRHPALIWISVRGDHLFPARLTGPARLG